MPEFWENDEVASSDSDWWKQDAVKPSTSTVTTPAASPVDHTAQAAENLAQGPYTPRVDPSLSVRPLPTRTLGQIITEGIPFTKLAPTAQEVQDAFDVLKAVNVAGAADPLGPTVQQQLEGPSTPPTAAAKVTAGAVQAGLTVPESFTSPLGVATLGTGALGATGARVVSGAFTADMLRHTPEQVVDVYEAFKLDLGPEEAAKRIGALTLNAAMIAATAKHAATAPKPVVEATDFVKPGDLLPQPIVRDVAPLEVAAVKAEAAGAPATAEAVRAPAALETGASPEKSGLVAGADTTQAVKDSLTADEPLKVTALEPLSQFAMKGIVESEPRVFFDDAVKKYTATRFHDKWGNMIGTGETPELAVSALNQHISAADRFGTWRSVNHPSAETIPPTAETKAPVAETKEPWQMRKAEGDRYLDENMINAVKTDKGNVIAKNVEHGDLMPALEESGSTFKNSNARGWSLVGRKPSESYIGVADLEPAKADFHKAWVMKALREGKPVPPEVLADYPDLKPAEAAPKGIAASARAKLVGESAGSESGAVPLPLWTARPLSRPLGEPYSEPLPERIRRLGGPVSAKVADEALQIVDHAKRMYGDLSARVLDDAKQTAGKAFRGGTTWIQGTQPVTERAATSRFHEVLEERVRTGNFDHVPAQYRPLVQKLWDANLEIGRLAQQANPQFVATGKAQRMLTAYGHDIVMRGRGRAWEAWAEGLATANGKTTGQVQHFLRAWKAEMDKPGADAAGLDRIAQDFVRQFPKVVTHIKPLLGWHEVVHSSPFGYLEQAAQRTASAVAFRQVHPVGSGSVEATRTAVQAELKTDRSGKEFDNAMRALQGHPIDEFSAWWNAPDTVLGATMRGTQIATKPLRSAMLTASLPTNIGESLSGGAQIFLGYGNAIRGAIQNRTLYQDLERSGMVNKAIRDFSFDPNQPMRSVSRYAGNLISRAFMNDFANEFQEYTGAATARLVADEVRNGTIDSGTKTKLVNTMRAMGITKENAQAAADGRNPEALNQFETKAAEFLSAGSQVTGEKSRLGASRAFNELFWFHSYPMSKVRQTRSVLNNIIEDATAKDWASAYQNSKLLGRVIGGTALGGAITIGVLTLVREGMFGTEIKKNEAQDDFVDFTKESFLMGFGGPLSIANRIWEQGGGIDEAASGLVLASAPLSLAKELSDAATQSGRYEGMTPIETVGEFLQSKTPGLRPLKYGMAVWGLAQDDPEFDAASRAFYRWRNDKFGSVKYKSHLKEDKDRKEFRGHMKQAVAALKDGDMDKFEARVDKAADVAESNTAIKRSFDARKLLRSPTGKAISAEELEELRTRIGDKAVEKLIGFDAMLESLSR